ncbi:MAG: ABC transporter ATP-binding protein [Thermoleophilia bacterium]|nr:ABC transporter ATP-binding protein [Thermoleophilia bacterium]
MTEVPGSVAVELRGVSHSYRSKHAEVVGLDNVDLCCAVGTWTAVMGPSGSGKSTLLYCAAGLERIRTGSVFVAGREITDASEDELTRMRRDTIGFVFQDFNLVLSLTAEQNVALPLRLAGGRPSRSEVRAVLDRVGVGNRGRHRPRELSGGQQQRVAIARAILTRPAVLLADEPTGALDSVTSRQVLAMFREMLVERQQTIVMVTHDPVVAAAADRIVFLSDGRIVDRVEASTPAAVAQRLARLEVRASGPG